MVCLPSIFADVNLGAFEKMDFFQHEAKCSEKSLVLVLPESKEETELYMEQETVVGGIHLNIYQKEDRQQDKLPTAQKYSQRVAFV